MHSESITVAIITNDSSVVEIILWVENLVGGGLVWEEPGQGAVGRLQKIGVK